MKSPCGLRPRRASKDEKKDTKPGRAGGKTDEQVSRMFCFLLCYCPFWVTEGFVSTGFLIVFLTFLDLLGNFDRVKYVSSVPEE